MTSYIIGFSTIYSLLNNCSSNDDENISSQPISIDIIINLSDDNKTWIASNINEYDLDFTENFISMPYSITVKNPPVFNSINKSISITYIDDFGKDIVVSLNEQDETGLIKIETNKGKFSINTNNNTFTYSSLDNLYFYNFITTETFTVKNGSQTIIYNFTFVPN